MVGGGGGGGAGGMRQVLPHHLPLISPEVLRHTNPIIYSVICNTQEVWFPMNRNALECKFIYVQKVLVYCVHCGWSFPLISSDDSVDEFS